MSASHRLDYEALLDSVDGIVWEADPETLQFRFVSKQAERLLGYPSESWVKQTGFWEDHIHPEDRLWAPGYCRREALAQRAHDFEYRMIAADGRTVWLRDICGVTVASGRLVSLHGVMVDITERKLAEEALRVTSERLRTLVTHAPIVLLAVNRAGVFTFCEGSVVDKIGIPSSEIVGRSLDELFAGMPGAEALRANWRRALAGEEFTAVESFERTIGETRYMTLRDAQGEPDGFIGVVVDVTDRVRAEEDHRALEKQMRQTQKLESLGVLAGGVAHDFNNLLMVVLGNADLLMADLPEDSPARVKLERIQRASRAASDLTQQLLSYAGSGECDARPLDFCALVREKSELLGMSISKQAELRLEPAEGLPPVECDAEQMTQVLLNLVTNASEALGDAGGTIRVRTGMVDRDRDAAPHTFLQEGLAARPHTFLEVSDTGVGMDETTLSRIFDPFFTTKFVGRGLGLATTLGIVRAHGGSVSVRSEPGQGTVFRVLLPCAATVEPAREAAPRATAGWQRDGTVLVVDDEPDILEIGREMLERLGFRVHSTGLGSDALEWIRTHPGPIAAALLDVTLPDVTGPEIARELQRARPGTPIVLMSGFQADAARDELPEDLRVALLQKPFARQDLIDALRDLTDSMQSAPEAGSG